MPPKYLEKPNCHRIKGRSSHILVTAEKTGNRREEQMFGFLSVGFSPGKFH